MQVCCFYKCFSSAIGPPLLFQGFIFMATKRNSVLWLAGRTVVDGGWWWSASVEALSSWSHYTESRLKFWEQNTAPRPQPFGICKVFWKEVKKGAVWQNLPVGFDNCGAKSAKKLARRNRESQVDFLHGGASSDASDVACSWKRLLQLSIPHLAATHSYILPLKAKMGIVSWGGAPSSTWRSIISVPPPLPFVHFCKGRRVQVSGGWPAGQRRPVPRPAAFWAMQPLSFLAGAQRTCPGSR